MHAEKLRTVANLILIVGAIAAALVFYTTGFEYYETISGVKDFHPIAFVYALGAVLPSLFAWALLLGLSDIIKILYEQRPEISKTDQ